MWKKGLGMCLFTKYSIVLKRQKTLCRPYKYSCVHYARREHLKRETSTENSKDFNMM